MKNDELKLQAKCHQWLWNCYPDFRYRAFQINNNSQNNVKGAINKASGIVKGISDYCIIFKEKTAYIEFKSEVGKQTKEQKQFQTQIELTNHNEYIVIRNFQDFQDLVISKLGEPAYPNF
jgi:hypothetical protein